MLKGQAKTDYMREYMRRRRAGAKPKTAVRPDVRPEKPKPAPARETALEQELAQAKQELAQAKARIRQLEAEVARKRETAPQIDPAKHDRIAELEAALKKTNRGFVWTAKQYRDVEFCTHPDRVAFLKDEALIARFEAAFRTVRSSKGLLMDKDAEQEAESFDRFSDQMRQRMAEVLRKRAAREAERKAKAMARSKARSEAAKRAAATRAAKREHV